MQMSEGQYPYLQGYYAVVDMFMAKAHGYPPINIMTGFQVVDSSSVDQTEPE